MVNIRIVLHNEVPCFILKGLTDMQYEITLWGCYNNGCGGGKAPIMMGHRSALSFAFNFLSILKVCLGALMMNVLFAVLGCFFIGFE